MSFPPFRCLVIVMVSFIQSQMYYFVVFCYCYCNTAKCKNVHAPRSLNENKKEYIHFIYKNRMRSYPIIREKINRKIFCNVSLAFSCLRSWFEKVCLSHLAQLNVQCWAAGGQILQLRYAKNCSDDTKDTGGVINEGGG